MNARCITETPLISSTRFLSDTAFSHAIPLCSIDTALTLFIYRLVTIIVSPIAADLGDSLRTRAPNATIAELITPAAILAWAFVAIVTLVGKTLSIDTASVGTVCIVRTPIFDGLAAIVDEPLSGRTCASIVKHDDACSIDAAMVTCRAIARKCAARADR
tara:strand:+ start:2833 stop:3312 length:480 start_codon:yes stop_codon:yes gene_type:complete